MLTISFPITFSDTTVAVTRHHVTCHTRALPRSHRAGREDRRTQLLVRRQDLRGTLGQWLACGAANPGCSRLSAGIRRRRRLAHGPKEPPERRLQARLPAPLLPEFASLGMWHWVFSAGC